MHVATNQHRAGLILLSAAFISALSACGGGSISIGGDPPNTVSAQEQIERGDLTSPRALGRLSLSQMMASCGVPGVSVAVVRDYQIAWTQGYGRTASNATPDFSSVQVNTPFQAGSISKPVAAYTVFSFAQSGALTLDENVTRYLRSWRLGPPNRRSDLTSLVTLRQLLNHTSGAADGFGFVGYLPGQILPSLPQILNGSPPSAQGAVTFNAESGTRQQYSGGGYVLVQQILQDIVTTGEQYNALATSRVLVPLRMQDSNFEQPPSGVMTTRAAKAHDAFGRRYSFDWKVHPELTAAGLWSTSRDLARLVIDVQQANRGVGGTVLSAASARQMLTPSTVGNFGPGMQLQLASSGYFGHSGANIGYRAQVLGHLTDGHGIVVMTNSDGGDTVIRELVARAARTYGWTALQSETVQPLPSNCLVL